MEGAQEPAAIRENFSRILEGVSPGVPTAVSVGAGGQPSLSTTPLFVGNEARQQMASSLKDPYQPINLLRFSMFPSVFTFAMFCIFMTPIWQMSHLGHDTTVRFWVGRWCDMAMFLPIIFIATHLIHIEKRTPHKPAVLASIFIPCIVLLILADVVMTTAYDKADQLFSTDCDTFSGKRELQREYVYAQELYKSCITETAAREGGNLTAASAAKLFRINDCEEYATAHKQHQRHWDYLSYLEEEHQCSGWCARSSRLWTFKDTQDPCTVAVSAVFRGKVQNTAKQVVVYIIFTMVLSAVLLIAVGPKLRARGIDW